jgi:hypothetical protein
MSPIPLSTKSAKPTTPARLGRTSRYGPSANAIMSNSKTTKFTFWTQPLGPAASADRMRHETVIWPEQALKRILNVLVNPTSFLSAPIPLLGGGKDLIGHASRSQGW